MTNSPAIRLSGVTRRFKNGSKSVTAISAINLEIRHGRRVALVGPSGSGKTTLLNLLGGLDKPDEGTVECLGFGLSCSSERDAATFRRRNIGFVFQDDALMPELTAQENIALPLVLLRKPKSEMNKTVIALMERLGLRERRRLFPASLSGGEKQRVAVARAVVHQPGLILADEPTSNLDLESAQRVLAALDAVLNASPATLVLATHDVRILDWFTDMIYLDDGRIRMNKSR